MRQGKLCQKPIVCSGRAKPQAEIVQSIDDIGWLMDPLIGSLCVCGHGITGLAVGRIEAERSIWPGAMGIGDAWLAVDVLDHGDKRTAVGEIEARARLQTAAICSAHGPRSGSQHVMPQVEETMSNGPGRGAPHHAHCLA